MRHVTIVAALLLAFSRPATAHENRCGYDFVQIGVPNNSGVVDFTSLLDINNRGLIVGGFSNSAPPRGYLLNGGIFRDTIELPNSTFTIPRSINNRGEIVGDTLLTGPSPQRVAFHRDAAGRYRTFVAVPNAFSTQAQAISNNGHIVGEYREANGRFHGFLWDGWTFQTIDSPFGDRTLLVGINRSGTIVGVAIDASGRNESSFVLSDGAYTLIDIPGSFGTLAADINDRGVIVGSFAATDPAATPSHVTRSFVLEDGTLTLIDASFPNVHSTHVEGINNRGDLVGSVLFSDFTRVGFVATRCNCTVATS